MVITWRAFSCLIALTFLACAPVHAGEIPLAWEHPGQESLEGFRIYYGLENVSLESPFVATWSGARDHVVPNLTDCMEWHLGIVSVGPGGLTSGWTQNPDGSNLIVKGWPQMRINSVSYQDDDDPAGVTRILGANFGPEAP